MFIGLVIWGK